MAMQQVQQLFLQAPMHKMSARDLGPSHMKEVRSHQSLASLDEDSADFGDEPTLSAAKISSSTDFAELRGAAAPGKIVALGAAPRLMEAANMKAAAADEGLLRPMELLPTPKVVAADDGPLRPMMLMGAFDAGIGDEPSGKPRARRGGNLQYAIEDEESFCGLQ